VIASAANCTHHVQLLNRIAFEMISALGRGNRHLGATSRPWGLPGLAKTGEGTVQVGPHPARLAQLRLKPEGKAWSSLHGN
jgi:hypothetical protein